MSRLYFLLFFLVPILVPAQVSQPDIQPQQGTGSDADRPQIDNTTVKVDGEKPPITDYLIISRARDTTHLDTTLTMFKDYKHNYLRRDDFELMPFQNVGQPYNRLGRSFNLDRLSPQMGATARHIGYIEVEDVNHYYVPTPLSDLYFKTAINQGQQLDALFTTNLSPQFNFSLSYKGVRSAGNYVNTLTSTGIFKITANYFTKDQRYRLRLHSTSQSIENEESGGIAAESLQGFLEEDEDLDDRGRLDPNLPTAFSDLEGRRFFIDHDYEIAGSSDSTAYVNLRAYNKAFYEDKFYRFEQTNPTTSFLGPTITSGGIGDKTNLEEGAIELGAKFDHYILGSFVAGVARQKFNYGYNRIISRAGDGGVVPDRIIGELYQFKAQFSKRLGEFDFTASGGINFAGDLDGQTLDAQASYLWKDVKLQAGIAINSRAPDFNYTLFQSDYDNYNWFNDFENINTQQLYFKADSERFANLEVSLSTIQNYTYFSENLILDSDGDITGYTGKPMQSPDDVIYLKVKAHKNFSFLKYFGMDNTIMYQSVQQSENNVFNVPDLTLRSTLFYKDRWFKKALLVQTGITLKYFTGYNMDAYDPVLGEFFVQNREEFGDFPMVDIFINAKVRQTRIFIKVEHVNQPLGDPDYFSAPRHPYRDLSIRFGVVWNFFL